MRFSERVIEAVVTFFYLGYLPLIPGTFASLAGVWLYTIVKDNLLIYISVVLALVALGLVLTTQAEKLFKKKDPRCIVIDEIAGMLISFMFVPYDVKLIVVGFFLFRLLDAFKPYPIKKIESLSGGTGIMLDDIIAGLYTNIILQVAWRLATFSVS